MTPFITASCIELTCEFINNREFNDKSPSIIVFPRTNKFPLNEASFATNKREFIETSSVMYNLEFIETSPKNVVVPDTSNVDVVSS